MKKFLLLPLILTTLILPGFAQPKNVPSIQVETSETIVEPKFIDELLSNYQAGKYDAFLSQMDKDYKQANEKWEYNGLLEERKKLSTMVLDFESPKSAELKKKLSDLAEQENRELVDFCLSHPTSPLTREVKDMVFFSPSDHEQESLHYISSLNLKFKGDGKTPLENKLIEIDTEFWIKSLSLDLLVTQNKIDQETFLKERAVLQFEKLKQMELATQGEDRDPQIKGYIETATKLYPKVQAATMTRQFLHKLAIGKATPQNATEEQFKKIAVKYHTKQQELVKKYFPEEQK